MIKNITDAFLMKVKINKLTADIIKLRAELKYWERQKGLAMQQKMGVKIK
jgi:hypothetical protein